MIETVTGDLLDAKVEALVNAVNTVGVMGKGLEWFAHAIRSIAVPPLGAGLGGWTGTRCDL